MKKSKQILLYLIFGALTTLVNIISFYLLTVLRVGTAPSTVIAWILSVIFAFFTNKIYVFESKDKGILKEISAFFGCRAFSGVFDLGVMILFVELLNFPSMLIKIFSNGAVIVMNYFFSKFLIFKNKKSQ